ncbi:proliferating cell nuclear antigen (pcna) [Candidatus Woesearchaeota archaeon]|nr:proliferating cell nuclear antigen (pcna) [Candidatus Woesearchaeota archaeon]
MRLQLAETRYLKDSISIISDLVNEATFKITPQAIELVAMDPANVAMVIYKLLSSCFTEYDVKEKVELAINLNNLKQILRRVKPDDSLQLEVEDNKLKVTLLGKTRRTFSIPILDVEEKEQKVPDLNFGATIKTSSTILTEAIEDVDIVGESVSFAAHPDKLMISAEGDLSKAHIDIEKGDHTQINIHSDNSLRSKYSIEYLKKMIAGGKLADEVMISFNRDYPLKLDFKAIDKVALSFILAPRVEND